MEFKNKDFRISNNEHDFIVTALDSTYKKKTKISSKHDISILGNDDNDQSKESSIETNDDLFGYSRGGSIEGETNKEKDDKQEESSVASTIIWKDQHGIRVDGRTPYDYRNIKILFNAPYLTHEERDSHSNSNALGKVEVRLGKTRVQAIASCSIVEPYVERPSEGAIRFNTIFSPMCSEQEASRYLNTSSYSRSSDMAITVSRVIDRSLRASRAIDTESLCIIAGKKVWSLDVDIIVIDDDGNLLDCAHIAAITSLLHFRRPDVSVQGDEVIIHSMEDREPIALSVHHIPICTSFAFFKGDLFVVDPSIKEEQVMSGAMTIAMNTHEEICAVQKGGGMPITVKQILKCTEISKVKVKEITKIVQSYLKQDEEERKLIKLPTYALKETVPVASKPSKYFENYDENVKEKNGDILDDISEDGELEPFEKEIKEEVSNKSNVPKNEQKMEKNKRNSIGKNSKKKETPSDQLDSDKLIQRKILKRKGKKKMKKVDSSKGLVGAMKTKKRNKK